MNIKGLDLIWICLVTLIFSSCYKDERNQLQSQVDSLKWVLESNQRIDFQLSEISDLLDSIDASRHVMRAKVVKDADYLGYANRLRDLNFHIKDTQLKIEELEKASSKVKGLRLSVQNLQNELAQQADELTNLEKKYSRYSTDIDSLVNVISNKDSVLYARNKALKVKEEDIAGFQVKLQEKEAEATIKISELYFAQAQALELAAQRTNFAPSKKKQTLQEALELYKISLAMGKVDAGARIGAIEKEIK